ncbi:MAG: DUF6089 family protein [Bacteroidota bacterium]|nr:hypothetical protein [Flavobacteriaceae bacterium]MEC8615277.1 DUF6089 family protein [Bacteroidota bacterium]
MILNSSYYSVHSQMHEFGTFLGGSNFIGDIGSSSYIKPNSFSFGLIYKWNLTTRYSLRVSYFNSNIKGDDFKSQNLNRSLRAYKFSNKINEFSSGIEFNFFDFNLHDEQIYFTPYIFTGINYFSYSLKKMNFTTLISEEYDKELNFALPIVFGLKSNLSTNLIFAVEIGFRYSFTDNIDASNPIKEYSQNNNLKFGNIRNKDWYTFSGITISYTFGRIPCYCKEK